MVLHCTTIVTPIDTFWCNNMKSNNRWYEMYKESKKICWKKEKKKQKALQPAQLIAGLMWSAHTHRFERNLIFLDGNIIFGGSSSSHHRIRNYGKNLKWRKNDLEEWKSVPPTFGFWLLYHSVHHHNILFNDRVSNLLRECLLFVTNDYISIQLHSKMCCPTRVFDQKCSKFFVRISIFATMARAHIQRSSNGFPNFAHCCQAFEITLVNHFSTF